MHDFIRPILEARRESGNDIQLFLKKRYLRMPYVFAGIMLRWIRYHSEFKTRHRK